MEVQPQRVQRELPTLPFQEWSLPDGRSWTRFHRHGECFLLRFPEFADFEIDGTAQVVKCFPVPGVSAPTVWHLFHNQVLPLALSCQGKLVLHASAVRTDHGAVAFIGASGKGKSTLAATLAANGYPFLTDDGLLLERAGERWLAMPSQPSIRLWEDAQLALVGAGAPAAPPLEFTSKGKFLSSDMLVHCDEPRALKCIYILGDGGALGPAISPLPLSEALVELVKHSFLLAIDESEMLGAHFEELSALVKVVPCVRFDYPRSFNRLDQVRASVIDHLRTVE